MTSGALLLFVAVYATAVATPGPGIAAILARAMTQGLSGALPFLLGFVAGDLVWFLVAAAGLSVVAKSHAWLFLAFKYAGCLYLLALAIQLWRAPPALIGEGLAAGKTGAWASFLGSFFLTLGNPKVMIFFLSIMPLAVEMERMTLLIAVELGVIIVVVISSILGGYMLLANRTRRLLRSKRAVGIVQKTNAGVLAGAAVVIATR